MKKLLLSPLLIVALLVLFGIGIAGAAIYIGAGTGGEINTESINLQKGLVGNWKMDGNAKDATSNSNHGIVTGATLTTDRKGQANKAYSFNGTSGYVSLASMPLSGTTYTVSAWFKSSDPSLGKGIFAQRSSTDTDSIMGQLYFPTGSSNIAFITRADNAENSALAQGTTTLQVDTWYHAVGVRDGANVYVYLNGVQEGTDTDAGGTITTNMADIGRYGGHTPAGYFNGLIDDVRIYNRALTAAEILALYQSYNPSVQISDLQKGLVGNWKMDGNAKDATSNSNHGTVTGATLTTDRKSQANKAYSFNGTTDYISMGDVLDFTGTSPFSVSAWIKPTTTTPGDYNQIVAKLNSMGDASRNGWAIFHVMTTGTIRIERWTDGSGGGVSSTTVPPTSTFTHIVGTYDGTNVRMYLNGVLEGGPTASAQSLTDNSNILRIGVTSEATSRFFGGSIDDVRIYNRALSQAEITALYQSYNPSVQISDLQKGLVGNWKFDGNAKDATVNSNHGSVSSATLTTDRKGQVNKAYNFDNTNDYINLGNKSQWNLASTNHTLAAWFKAPSKPTDDYARLFDRFTGGTPGAGYFIGMRSASGNIVAQERVTEGTLSTEPAINYADNNWHHLVFTVDISTKWGYLYIDNVLVGSDSYTGDLIDHSSSLGIGGQVSDPTDRAWNGLIDDVRIYNRALSQTEITALYESY